MPRPIPTYRHLAAFAAIALLTVFCYLPALHGEFQFDDAMGIERGGWLLPKGKEFDTIAQTLSGWTGRGLVTATYQVNYWMAGGDELRMRAINQGMDAYRMTPPFHAFNIAFHVLVAAALYALLAWMTWRLGRPSWIAPALGTALFALHPLCTESVAYISARPGPMAAFFALMGIAAFLTLAAPRPDGGPVSLRARLLGAGLLALCALMSVRCKETGWMVLPMAVLALAWSYLGDWKACLREWGLATAAGLVVFLAVFGIWIRNLGLLGSAWTDSYCSAYGFHPADAGDAILCHIGTQLHTWWATQLPRVLLPTGLSHPTIELDPPILAHPSPVQQAWLALEVALTLGAAGWALWRWKSPSALGLSWIALGLIPVSYAAMQDVSAERHAYLPLIGGVLVALPLLEAAARRKGTLLAAGVAVACLGLMTAARAGAWTTEESLWESAIRDSPRKPRPYYNMAKAMIRRATEVSKTEPERGKELAGEAEAALHRCIQITPTFHLAHGTLGREYHREGKWAEAVPEFRMAAELHARACASGEARELHASQVTGCTCALGECLKNLGRLDEAMRDFHVAIDFHLHQAREAAAGSRMRMVHARNAGELFRVLTKLLMESGRRNEARQVADEGLRLFPDFPELKTLRKDLDGTP